jgi:hypothetical protein
MSEENKEQSGDQESKETTADNQSNVGHTDAQADSTREESTITQPEASPEASATPVESEEVSEPDSPAEQEVPEVLAADTSGDTENSEAATPEEEAVVSNETSATEEPAKEKAPEQPDTVAVTESTEGKPEREGDKDTASEAKEAAEVEEVTEGQPESTTEPATQSTPEETPVAESTAAAESPAATETSSGTAETDKAAGGENEEKSLPANEKPATQDEGESKAETEAVVAEESVKETTEETSTAKEMTDRGEKPEDEEKSEEEEEDEEEGEIIDYSNHSREELADVVEELSKQDNFKRADAILNQVLPLFKAVERASRLEAKERFLADGGEEDDFEFRHDDVFNRFDASLRLLRDRKSNYYKERESRKENNYKKKLEVLDKLRELVDGENATTNLAPIKALQEEWKSIGMVPAQHNRTLWANYNALMDRFYNNRHILFELKELDRKKNLVKKQEICEKAEALDKLENIKEAIVQLNELHEEYKKIGPVPREVQEELWQRFKAASDEIYKKRKSYLEELKGELQENLEKKKVLAEQLKPYLEFDSDRINDWNAKTKEILAIQKKWDALGGLPREHAKEVNRAFWSSFKGFFSNKNNFFKKLEGMRQENLEKKEALVEKANALKESTDWDKTSEALKGLQREWKEIGPVPEKFRNSVYAKFKEACDTFFNNRRKSQNKAEEQYVENLQHKEELIKEVEERTKEGKGEARDLDDLMVRWGAIGFVPRNSIKSIEAKFKKAIDAFLASMDMEDTEREALVMKAELSTLKKGPDADRKLNKKEYVLRKQIQELEDNIALWNNNLAFFANSKTADKLKAEFDEKIVKAKEEVQHLKKQLRMIRSM